MPTKKIVSLLRGLAVFCYGVGLFGSLIGAFICFIALVPGIIIIVACILIGALGYVTYSAMANMMAAIDSIARSNIRIAKALTGHEDNNNEEEDDEKKEEAEKQDSSLPQSPNDEI